MRRAFLDHLALTVRDLEASRRFYAAALAPWQAREVEMEPFVLDPDGHNVGAVFHGSRA